MTSGALTLLTGAWSTYQPAALFWLSIACTINPLYPCRCSACGAGWRRSEGAQRDGRQPLRWRALSAAAPLTLLSLTVRVERTGEWINSLALSCGVNANRADSSASLNVGSWQVQQPGWLPTNAPASHHAGASSSTLVARIAEPQGQALAPDRWLSLRRTAGGARPTRCLCRRGSRRHAPPGWRR